MMIAGLLLATALADEAPKTEGFDHSHQAFAKVLDGAVHADGVDYRLLKSRRGALGAYLDQVGGADISGWSTSQQLALWVNSYNALTLALILDEGPKSILDLDGGKVWKTRTYTVAGTSLTLDQIEHAKARPLADGRVHAVVNCASKGCPPLPPKPLDSTRALDPQLDAAAAAWTRHNAYTLDGSGLALSQIFNWFGEDFGTGTTDADKQAAAVAFIQRYTDDPTDAALTAATQRRWADYDWSLNGR